MIAIIRNINGTETHIADARDESHADRIIARRRAALPLGSSTTFIRRMIKALNA